MSPIESHAILLRQGAPPRGATPSAARARADAAVWERVGFGAVLALIITAPFELPLATVGAFTLTSTELALALAVTTWLAGSMAVGDRIQWRTPLTWPGAAFLGALLLAATFAPTASTDSLKFAARMVAAGSVALLVANTVDTVARARLLVVVLMGVAGGIGAIAVLEAWQVPAVMQALTAFRPGFHVVGGHLRATSTLFYPTIASMYLEIAFALGLWILIGRSRRWSRAGVAAFAALLLMAAGIIATFTRAGLIGMAAALALVAILLWRRTETVDGRHVQLGALAIAIGMLVLASRSPDLLLARFGTEGSQAWYGARYRAPATLSLTAGRDYRIPVTLENTGRLPWDSTQSPPFAMSYHWLRADSEAVVQFDGWRTPFPAAVPAGSRITLPVAVQAPARAGTYVLVWDVVHEDRAWLSTEGVEPARTVVDVEGAAAGEVTTAMPRLPAPTLRLERPVLWQAAWAMARDHPWTGVGPDNFRHVYGRYAGLARWDTRVHANNMYLDVLAGAGMIGLAALVWLVGGAGLALWRQWRAAHPDAAPALAAMLAAWLMVAGHAMVDSFLSFTTTYVMFAVVAGLACSPAFAGLQVGGRAVASRRGLKPGPSDVGNERELIGRGQGQGLGEDDRLRQAAASPPTRAAQAEVPPSPREHQTAVPRDAIPPFVTRGADADRV